MIQIPTSNNWPSLQGLQLDPEASVFDWNNKAVLRMQHGRCNDAISILGHLLQALEREEGSGELHHFQSSPCGSSHLSQGVASRTRSQTNRSYKRSLMVTASPPEDEDNILLMTVPVNTQLQAASGFSHANADASFVLFDQAFVTVLIDQDPHQGRRLTRAFCCYNLALCLHYKEYVRLSERETRCLQAALWYYRQALTILEPNATNTGTPRSDDTSLLMLAIFNNLGHLYQILSTVVCDSNRYQPQTRHCAEWMRSLLATKARSNAHPATMSRDWSFFCHALRTYNQHERKKPKEREELYALAPAA